MRFVTSLAVLVMTAASAHAAVLLTEDFNSYSDGELRTVGAAKWSQSTTGNGLFTVASKKLFINDEGTNPTIYGTLSESVSSSGTNKKIYASYKMTVLASDYPRGRYDTSISTTGPYVSAFAQSTTVPTNFTSKVYTSRRSTTTAVAGEPYTLSLNRAGNPTSGDSNTLWADKLALGSEHLIVVAFDFTTNTSTLWVDPTSEGDTNVINTLGTTLPASLNYFAFHITNSNDGDKYIDDLRVATTFAEAVPEPTAFGLIGIGSLLALRRRRRVEH